MSFCKGIADKSKYSLKYRKNVLTIKKWIYLAFNTKKVKQLHTGWQGNMCLGLKSEKILRLGQKQVKQIDTGQQANTYYLK